MDAASPLHAIAAAAAAPSAPAESGLIKCVELLRSVEDYHSACPKIHEIKVGGSRAQRAQRAQQAQRFIHCSKCNAAPPAGSAPRPLAPAHPFCPSPPFAPCRPNPLPPQFNSTNKWQLSIHRPESASAQHPILVLKGAPERVLRMCTHIMVDGESVPMDASWQNKYNEGGCWLLGTGCWCWLPPADCWWAGR